MNAIIGHVLMVVGAILAGTFAGAIFEAGGQSIERANVPASIIICHRVAGALAIFLAVMFGRFV